MIFVEGEWLEGFHFELVPQLSHSIGFDEAALGSLAGMRAVWLLVCLGRWDYLEDLGVDRETIGPLPNYGRRLTPRQASQLRKRFPVLEEASKELRLAYALKEKRMTTQQAIYHAEVESTELAYEIAGRHRAEIEAAGGSVEVGSGRGKDDGAIIMVKLPASLEVDPANLFQGSGLRFGRVRAMTIPIPQNLSQEEEIDG